MTLGQTSFSPWRAFGQPPFPDGSGAGAAVVRSETWSEELLLPPGPEARLCLPGSITGTGTGTPVQSCSRDRGAILKPQLRSPTLSNGTPSPENLCREAPLSTSGPGFWVLPSCLRPPRCQLSWSSLGRGARHRHPLPANPAGALGSKGTHSMC